MPGTWKSKLTQRRLADNSGRKKSLWEMDQNLVRPVMPEVKTCQMKALDQSSRGFWYFEHLNLAYRAAQMQSLTQEDGFYHTLSSTSILSTFLLIGPYWARYKTRQAWYLTYRWNWIWLSTELISRDGRCKGMREHSYEGDQVFPHFVKKYQSVKVKPLLERWQTCLISPAKRFVKVNQLGYWSSVHW